MDLATLIGLIFGTVTILLAIIGGGDMEILIKFPGLLMVLGGNIAATLIGLSLSDRPYAINLGLTHNSPPA